MKLVHIDSYEIDWIDGFIMVDVMPNPYTHDSIMILLDDLRDYLERHDRFTYHDVTYNPINGIVGTNSYNITFKQYWECLSYTDKTDDLYEYIVTNKIGFSKSLEVTINQINSILKHFNQ